MFPGQSKREHGAPAAGEAWLGKVHVQGALPQKTGHNRSTSHAGTEVSIQAVNRGGPEVHQQHKYQGCWKGMTPQDDGHEY